VVLGGVGFNATNDKLILDTDITLRSDITATNKVIGTVAGLEYTYTHSSQTLIISKTSGTFTAEDVAKVVEAMVAAILPLNVMSVSSISLSLVALKPTPPNTTLIDLISVSVVFEISASKATPTAIS
jgi:hypothetical protein